MIPNKSELRAHYLALRRSLSDSRKREAASQLFETMQRTCLQFEKVASFCSTKDEIDMSALNQWLAQSGRLLLPRCTEEDLQYYLVSDLNSLQKTRNNLLEPDPTLCQPATPGNRDLILVPGLAFDKEHFRLGYGKGHFDKFLARHPTIPTSGIGFREQKSPKLLPRDPWDLPVQTLLLF